MSRKYRKVNQEKLSDINLINEVEQLYLHGVYCKIIAEKTGLTKNQVEYILFQKLKVQALNPKRKRNTFRIKEEYPQEKINRIIVLTNFGYSAREISEDQSIPEFHVCRIVDNAKKTGKICKKV